jgi:hypothetical protein
VTAGQVTKELPRAVPWRSRHGTLLLLLLLLTGKLTGKRA